jgi:hypothetical protein
MPFLSLDDAVVGAVGAGGAGAYAARGGGWPGGRRVSGRPCREPL